MIKKYKIILTVSLDGPEEVNNKNRISRDGGNVYIKVMKNIERLEQNGIRIQAIEATYTKNHYDARINQKDLMDFFS